MAKSNNWLVIAVVVAIAAAVLMFSQGNLSGAATSFGTSGVSARELPKGICVVEVDEVIVDDSREFLDLVITETGRKPAFGKVQSLWIYGDDENGGGLVGGQYLVWEGKVRTQARTLAGISTGVAESEAMFFQQSTVIGVQGSAVDLVANPESGMGSNGMPIASQGSAGEVRLGLAAFNEVQTTWDLHVAAVVESPVGNLCTINLVPRRAFPLG